MYKHRFLKLLWAIPPAILLLLYAISFSGLTGRQTSSLLLIAFGGFISFDGISILHALAFCLLFVVQLTLLGNEFRDDFDIASTYLFTRGAKKEGWLARKFYSLAEQSILFYLIMFATVIGCSSLIGYTLDALKVIIVVVCLLLTLALTNTLFVLAVNLLAIRLNVSLVYTFMIGLYTGWIVLLPLLGRFDLLLRLFPVTYSILLMYELPVSLSEMSEILPVPFRIPIASTIFRMLIGGGMLYAISTVWIRNTDLLGGNDA